MGRGQAAHDRSAECAFELAPNLPFAHFRLAQGYEGKGMYDEAVTAFEKAIELGEASVGLKGYLGRTYGLAGRRSEPTRR